MDSNSKEYLNIMDKFIISDSSSDSEFEILQSKSVNNSNSLSQNKKNHSNDKSYKLLSKSPNEIEKIIGINQSSFDESSSPIMFYVKFKNQSYQCCKWISKRTLCETQRGAALYKRFLKNPTPFRQVHLANQLSSTINSSHTNDTYGENNFQLYKPTRIEFDRGFITPEKVISIQKKNGTTRYLIKWISLDIAEATWENDAPQNLIDEYKINISKNHSRCFNIKENKESHNFIPFKKSPKFKNDHKLEYYQVDALNWLLQCWFNHRNSILADEMGLGKTIESISFLYALSKIYSSWGPFIVVCPLSTVTNWIDEFEQWTNFRVVCLIGNDKSRQITKENLIYHWDQFQNKHDTEKIIFDVIIISYEMLSIELSFIKKFNFMCLIIDEAQKIKNAKSKTYQNCASIQSYYTLLMTGTPVQNSIYEIWSLLHFISPKNIPDFEEFSSQYGDIENAETIDKFQELLSPYMLRRKKSEVNLNLPEKEETIIEVEMTQIQRTFSQLTIRDNLDIWSNVSSIKVNLNNLMMKLRKLFCHPFLLPELELYCVSQYKESHSIPSSQALTYEQEMESLIFASGKTILIDKLLPKLKDGNHKVLIFSQMTTMLDILEDYLTYKRYSYERLDGSCTSAKRTLSIERFQKNDDIFAFLISTRAGGLGINLTQADTVIIYDSDWNPQNDIQALSRCYRFGQTKKVNIYRLITRGSYESEMFLRASKKLALDFAILDSGSSYSPSVSNSSSMNSLDEKSGSESDTPSNEDSKMSSREELEMILKNGAYYTFKDDPKEIEKFCLENIDTILEHRSHTKVDLVSGGNSRFSKVTFDAGTETTDIDKEEFWNNLINENDNSLYNDDSGIKTRHKKNINYAENKVRKIKKKGEGEGEEEEEDEDEPTSSDNDIDFVPSKSTKSNENERYLNSTRNFNSIRGQNSNTGTLTLSALPNLNTTSNLNPKMPHLFNTLQNLNNNPKYHTIPNPNILQNSSIPNLTASQSLSIPKLSSTQSLNNIQKVNQNQNTGQKRMQIVVKFPNSVYSKVLGCFESNLPKEVYDFAIDAVTRHGVFGCRLFVSEFIQEICKSLISIAYINLPERISSKYKNYIAECVSDPYKQIFKTQFRELNNFSFVSSFFNHKEEEVISKSFNWDILYKTAIFISNGKLPPNFQFAPEMATPIGWTITHDFVLISSSPFMSTSSYVLMDKKLPYYLINEKYCPSEKWFLDRIQLIIREVFKLIPKDFSVFKKSSTEKDKDGELLQFNNFKFFSQKNNNVVFPNILSKNFQLKFLRIFYLYGIPTNDTLEKLKTIVGNSFIKDGLIKLFICKLLLKAMKYEEKLCDLLNKLPKIDYSWLQNNNCVNIKWIKDEAIQAVASNVLILYEVRENFQFFNNNKSEIFSLLPDWNEIKDRCSWWDTTNDEALFKNSAFYGFLFNSMLAYQIPLTNASKKEISDWREEEALTLTPICHKCAEYLKPVFPLEVKKRRLIQILDAIKMVKSQNE